MSVLFSFVHLQLFILSHPILPTKLSTTLLKRLINVNLWSFVCVCGKHSIEESTLMCTPTNPSDSSWAATVHSSFRSRYCKCRKFFIEYLPTTNTWHFGDPQINQPPPTMDRNASALVILNGGNDAITYRLNDLKECSANAINQMSCMHSPLISIVRWRYISAIHRNKKNCSRARVCKEFYCFS